MDLPRFSKSNLLSKIKAQDFGNNIHIAFSGGLDSHVLLHAMASLRSELDCEIIAIHVNHRMQDKSDSWALHCEEVCRQLNVEYKQVIISDTCPRSTSLEEWARDERYRLITNIVGAGVFLTAHTSSDQTETILLNLLRGSGVKGLAAMPEVRRRNNSIHFRPLLEYSREQLLEYARAHSLNWVEDTSNSDRRFDRNFIRHEIASRLRDRWPNSDRVFSRAALLQMEADSLLNDLAALDLGSCQKERQEILDLSYLLSLSEERKKNLLRYWLSKLKVTLPGYRKMQEISSSFINSARDATPVIELGDHELRRYRSNLYLLKKQGAVDKNTSIDWKVDEAINLPDDTILKARLKPGVGIKKDFCPANTFQIRYRQGGETIKLPDKQHSQQLKKLFQEKGLPPWIRPRIPLLYLEGQLVAVADYWIDSRFLAKGDELCWHISWENSYLG